MTRLNRYRHFLLYSEVCAILRLFGNSPPGGGKEKRTWIRKRRPKPARPKLNPYTKALRRERIFARLRLGLTYEKIAREEGVSDRRIRQIVADALRRQEFDDPTDHAIIQLMRLDSAHELAARAVDSGDLRAIDSLLKVLDESTAIIRPERAKQSTTPPRGSGCSPNSTASPPALPPPRLPPRPSKRTRPATRLLPGRPPQNEAGASCRSSDPSRNQLRNSQ